MSAADKIRFKLQTATVVEKLIAVNVLAFLVFYLFRTIAYLFNFPSDFLLEWLVFPKEPLEYIMKPWSIITYAFLHSGIWHIASNMLILYFSGIYFLNYFSPKRLLNYYFLGIIIGALVYMLSYNLFSSISGYRQILFDRSFRRSDGCTYWDCHTRPEHESEINADRQCEILVYRRISGCT